METKKETTTIEIEATTCYDMTYITIYNVMAIRADDNETVTVNRYLDDEKAKLCYEYILECQQDLYKMAWITNDIIFV